MKGGSMDKYDDLQIALTAARDNLKSLNEKIGREQFRFVFVFTFHFTRVSIFHWYHHFTGTFTGNGRTGTETMAMDSTRYPMSTRRDPGTTGTMLLIFKEAAAAVVSVESDRRTMCLADWSRGSRATEGNQRLEIRHQSPG